MHHENDQERRRVFRRWRRRQDSEDAARQLLGISDRSWVRMRKGDQRIPDSLLHDIADREPDADLAAELRAAAAPIAATGGEGSHA